jgi:hypothetical protein
VAHAGERKSSASVGTSCRSSQANLPDLLVLIILVIFIDFLVIFVQIIIVRVVVWRLEIVQPSHIATSLALRPPVPAP